MCWLLTVYCGATLSGTQLNSATSTSPHQIQIQFFLAMPSLSKPLRSKLRTFTNAFRSTKQPQPRRYKVDMPPEMDDDMGELAERLGVDRSEVFCYAMMLYIELKKRQLDQEEKSSELPFHIFLENEEGHRIEFVDPLKLSQKDKMVEKV